MVNQRAQPGRVLTIAAPSVAGGQPVVPRFRASIPNGATALEGPGHLRAVPLAPPAASGNGAGASVKRRWHTRWAVESLPDPSRFNNGWYWLGDAESIDGTSGLPGAARLWSPASGSGPSWHSHYPYKPSVTAVDHYLFGGEVVHHPRGVNFNSHYIEHMWADWGSAHRQPFTWVIAACVTGWDSKGDQHFLLDAGRNPRTWLSAAQERDYWRSHHMPHEADIGYHTWLGVTPGDVRIRTRIGAGQMGRVASHPALHPKMYVGIFNGAKSAVGVYTPTLKRLRAARLDSGGQHRYYLLGRGQNWVAQNWAGSLLIFEMRFYNFALDANDLRQNYNELAAHYSFHRYSRS